MIRHLAATALAAMCLAASPVAAGAPEISLYPAARPSAAEAPQTQVAQLRPKARPQQADLDPPVVARMALAQLPNLRPALRPLSEQQARGTAARAETAAYLGLDVSARPFARPDSIVQQALFGKRKKRKGSVCGDIDIQGEKVGRVPGKQKGCGIKDAVRVRSVSGVRLSRPATMDCTTARALNSWVKLGVKPAFRRRGPVVEMQVAAHYACRTRNNQRGARISEHGKGKAIDISAFTMNDGEVITVAKHWGQGSAGRLLRKVWKSACGPFGTVLGPQADRFHRDHFHMDTASYRSGPYCK